MCIYVSLTDHVWLPASDLVLVLGLGLALAVIVGLASALRFVLQLLSACSWFSFCCRLFMTFDLLASIVSMLVFRCYVISVLVVSCFGF